LDDGCSEGVHDVVDGFRSLRPGVDVVVRSTGETLKVCGLS